MFIWHHAPVAEYWPLWARQMGSLLQLLPILCIPLVALIQSYRYLNNGPNDILDVSVIWLQDQIKHVQCNCFLITENSVTL